ncbi:hypothetical protein H2203_001394 [Taxawa tesnikishii (nom. ined.)]|nr:hypothetical protein H2203_001394 [Dothideales sp. JES 119]
MELDDIAQKLATRALRRYDQLPNDIENPDRKSRRLLIGVAGGPGSGKSTMNTQVADIVSRDVKCQVVELEGFFKPKSELNKMNDPDYAHFRRGATWTIDTDGVVNFIRKCRQSKPDELLKAPSFSDEKMDPVPDGQRVNAPILILDGIYLLSKDQPWRQVGEMLDERWFMHVVPETTKERIAKRRVDNGLADDKDHAREMYEQHDGKNYEYVLNSMGDVDIIIENHEDKKTVKETEHGRNDMTGGLQDDTV